jgi:glycosyltransferase involved in cell wall biosynthesis
LIKIGIGIVTFNRLERLKQVVAAVRKHTKSYYELVIAEDGGSDGSREWCKSEGLRVISGPNAGVCWNKNRALFALQSLGCDPILLLEDDCYPVEDGWDQDWRVATALYGHVSYAHPKLNAWKISGSGRATDPVVNYKATAQCSSVSGIALAETGYLDTRFKGYGVGHAEWTTRMKRGGFGYRKAINVDGRLVKANLYINGGLVAEDAPTFKDRSNIAKNEALFDELKSEPPYRHPWSSEDEKVQFLKEQASAKINDARYQLLIDSAAADEGLYKLRHLKGYGKSFQRVLHHKKSFLRASGWLSSMAITIPAYEGEVVPWFNYAMIELLRERVKAEWRVFEFGAGFSTLWWATHVAEVHSVEHDSGWSDVVRDMIRGYNATITAQADEDAFVGQIETAPGPFDVIVVDGKARPRCAVAALQHLTPNGVIIYDNTNREEYTDAREAIRAAGFKELRLKSPAPMTYLMETTSIFYRTQNCLDL